QVDAVDAAVDRVAALRRAIHAPVVGLVVGHAPAAHPAGGVGQQLVATAGAADRRAVLVGGLRQAVGGSRALPPEEDVHAVVVVDRHPGAGMRVAVELAVG